MSAERVAELLQHLDRLPAELADWLRNGFEAHAAGGDLLAALDLDCPDLDQRDEHIRTCVALSPGESLAARIAFFLGCLTGNTRHPRRSVQRLIRGLRAMSCPRSPKQLRRICAGRRRDGWDINGQLCPTGDMVQAEPEQSFGARQWMKAD